MPCSASQIWGTRYMKQEADQLLMISSSHEMDCPLQTVHMCLLKGILGVKRTTPDLSVLRECVRNVWVVESTMIDSTRSS